MPRMVDLGIGFDAFFAKKEEQHKAWADKNPKGDPIDVLAQSFLDRHDEDWTFVDPEEVKALARAVLGK